jgi:uncharacterized protein YkwD
VIVATALVACVPPKKAVPPAAAAPTTWQQAMLDGVNAQRAAQGRQPLVLCAHLTAAAQAHSDDQAAHQNMSHVGSDNSTMTDRVVRAGYVGWNRLAENVAAGYPDIPAVIAGWMGSSGHRTNILEPATTHLGVGWAKNGNTIYWTQDFGAGGAC